MSRNAWKLGMFVAALLVLGLGTSGCSTLGLTHSQGQALTKEAEAVLDQSRVPRALPRENAKTVLPPHRLQPGDTVLIEPVSIQRDLRLPADQAVLADGTIDLGPFGRLIVAGSTLEEAEMLTEQQIDFQTRRQREACHAAGCESQLISTIRADLPDDCDSIAINVRLLEPVHRYYVLGEVNAPGSYPLAGFETVLDAIVTAGGLSSNANPCQILLSRPTDPCECRVALPVCYREIVQLGNTASNYQLRPGDRIFVASRSCVDELMFWRARQACPRCSTCNRPCAHPELVAPASIHPSVHTMIEPGSSGWMKLSNSLPNDDTMMESSRPVERSPGSNNKSFDDYLHEEPGISRDGAVRGANPSRQSPASDVDGELDFAPLLDE